MSKYDFIQYHNYYENLRKKFMTQAKVIAQNDFFINKAHWSIHTLNELILKMRYGDVVEGLKRKIDATGKECLLLNTDNAEELIPYEESFNILFTAHLATDHGSVEVMRRHIDGKIFPFFCIPLIISVCDVCKKKSILPNSWQVIISNINPIDDQYNHVLIYREKTINHLFMRPLRRSTVTEMAIELLQLFLQFGIPNYLEFSIRKGIAVEAIQVMNIIKTMHPPCANIICMYDVTKVENSGEIQRISKAITEMMENCHNNNWVLDCHITQYKLNMTRTVIFNYGGEFLTTGIPFELFMGKGANVTEYRKENVINAFEWDMDSQYMDRQASKQNRKTCTTNCDALKNFMQYISLKQSEHKMCSACLRKNFQQIFCRNCKTPIHITCGEIIKKSTNNIDRYEIECLVCLRKHKRHV
ncbi:hypothetical protein K1T71_012610 [Dendrolimus kikuchii]|uniref:Uncharacterized protein n=1 Tax=Dendrolimus kikuchii TaxID=765133 RepID=A0ACC1CK50_9NEOP|nr:hypothetical protein K1T71_012610 [Dendrolimus kikuchii]